MIFVLMLDFLGFKVLGKKRVGILFFCIKKFLFKLGDINKDVVDFVWVVFIWYEDEIMIYDFDDEDDDGIGINGVGFKFMVVIVYVCVMKCR